MTRHEALTALLEKVEDGTAEMFDPLFELALYPAQQSMYAVYAANGAYKGGFDAAKVLHEAVANTFVVTIDRVNCGQWIVTLRLEPEVGTFSAKGHNPARAWLIAILKALIAMKEDQ